MALAPDTSLSFLTQKFANLTRLLLPFLFLIPSLVLVFFHLLLYSFNRITKQKDPVTSQLSLLFLLKYPEIVEGLQPRHRFMSAYEQRREKPDPRYQYLLFAAEPYETVAFKIPNRPIDKEEGRFYTNWDRERLVFTLQFYFEKPKGKPEAERDDEQSGEEGESKQSNPFQGIPSA